MMIEIVWLTELQEFMICAAERQARGRIFGFTLKEGLSYRPSLIVFRCLSK